MQSRLPRAAGSLVCAALAMPAFAQDGPNEDTRAIERRTQQIRESAAPSVVSVRVTRRDCKLPRLAFPGVTIAPTGAPEQRVEGTGFLVAGRGLVVTTRDVVCDAARIELRFHDGTLRDASLLGSDGPFCVAVLRTSAPDSAVPMPASPRVEVGRSTVGWLLGAPTGRASSPDVQVSLVRAAPEQGATYDRYLYAPVAIVRGAAGGPLVGEDGSLLGMAVGSLVARDDAPAANATVPFPRATLFVRGDDVAEAARQIAANGSVLRAMLGTLIECDSNRVGSVLPGSPAQAAGLAEGDAIVGIGSMTVANYADLTRALLRRRPGDRVKVTIERDGARFAKCVPLVKFEPPPEPSTPPVAGATIEVAGADTGDMTFTFSEVEPESPAAKAGAAVGDRIVAVDGMPPLRFLLRHRAGVSQGPSRIVIRRGDATVELSLAGE